jgi:nitrogen fixation/metabolism regulation signal transduction histidine kinase
MRGPGPKWHEKHRAAFRMAASVQPKDEAEREMLAQAAQSVQAKQASRKTHQMRFALWVVPLTVAALLGAVAVAAAFA